MTTRTVALLLLLSGCGGIEASTTGSDAGWEASAGSETSAPEAPEASPDSSGDADAETFVPSQCPTSAPSDGSPCSNGFVACDYGEDPRPPCRTRAVCRKASPGAPSLWSVTQPLPADCHSIPVECPPTADALVGASCATREAFCFYSDKTCECALAGVSGGGASSTTWICDSPDVAEGCPARLPPLGSSCAVGVASCTWGVCGLDDYAVLSCADGVWSHSPGAPSCGL